MPIEAAVATLVWVIAILAIAVAAAAALGDIKRSQPVLAFQYWIRLLSNVTWIWGS